MNTEMSIENTGGTLESCPISWSERQSCNPAIRNVPLDESGAFIDTGTFTIENRMLRFVLRLTDAEKTTLRTIFDESALVTIIIKIDRDSNYPRWEYTAWLTRKMKQWEYRKSDSDVLEWYVELELYCSEFSYEVSA